MGVLGLSQDPNMLHNDYILSNDFLSGHAAALVYMYMIEIQIRSLTVLLSFPRGCPDVYLPVIILCMYSKKSARN